MNGSVSSVTVTGLLSNTMYSCTIFGYSQLVGPVSDPVSATTLQSGTIIGMVYDNDNSYKGLCR